MALESFILTDEWRTTAIGDADDDTAALLRRGISGEATLTPVIPEGSRVVDDPRAWAMATQVLKGEYHVGRLIGPDGHDGVRLVGWIDGEPIPWRVSRRLRFNGRDLRALPDVTVMPGVGVLHLPDAAPVDPEDVPDLGPVLVDIGATLDRVEGLEVALHQAISDGAEVVRSEVAGYAERAEFAAAAAWEAVDTPGRQGAKGDDGDPGPPGALTPEDRALVVAATGHAADAAQSAADALVSAGMAEDSAQAAAQSAVDAAESVTSGLVDGSVTRVKLAMDVTGELEGKAPVVHEHTMAQISDLPEVAQLATGDALVRRWIDGSISVPLSPEDPADATSKNYVDSAVADAAGAVSSVNAQTGDVVLGAADVGAAPASHTHVIGDVGGLSAALDGKASTSHTHVVADVSDATAVGRSVVTASSAAAARSAIGAGTSSLVLGTGAGQAAAGDHSHTAASIGAAPVVHEHLMGQITDLPAVSQQATAGALVQRQGDSQITVPEVPSDPSDAVAKSYVDSRIQLVETLPTTGAPGVLYVVEEA